MASTPRTAPVLRADLGGEDDIVLVERARANDEAAIGALVRRHNQRLFRVARAILHSDAEAEDVVQAAYVNAFTHLASFRGEARLTTWLTRITVNEATERLRRTRQTTEIDRIDIEMQQSAQILQFPSIQPQLDPEAEMSRQEIRHLLEQAIDTLSPDFRAVFVLRDVEGMNVEETAAALQIKSETVRTRLHRARRLMRAAIEKNLAGAFASVFPFDGARCANMADRVVAKLEAQRG